MNDYFKYDDAQLVALIKEGSTVSNEAFNVLYYRYSERIKSYCIFRTCSKEDAEEIFQETWIKFLDIIKKGKIEMSLPAYLYSIAHNLCINLYISNKMQVVKFPENLDFDFISDQFSLQVSIENRELLVHISLAIQELDLIYREPFILKWFAGLTQQAIADLIGETVDCVKKRNTRALEEIKKNLQLVIKDVNK